MDERLQHAASSGMSELVEYPAAHLVNVDDRWVLTDMKSNVFMVSMSVSPPSNDRAT